MPTLYQTFQISLIGNIYFIYQYQYWNLQRSNFCNKISILICFSKHRSHKAKHQHLSEQTLKTPTWIPATYNWASIHREYLKNNLTIIRIDNSHNTMTRRLSLKCRNGNTLSHNQIHERRLTDIGITHNIYKTCLMFHIIKKLKNASETFIQMRFYKIISLRSDYFFEAL